MFIPLSEVPSKALGSGEERHYFYFYERNSELPVEVVITRLPPFYDANRNWHKHDFVEEFSVPLMGELVIREKGNGKEDTVRKVANSILRGDEWVVGIECSNPNEVNLLLESASGGRRKVKVVFDEKFSEGKNDHRIENPTNSMITVVTMKRVPKKILKKDPLIFRVDRNPALDER